MKTYVRPAVGRLYRFDWQYAVDISRIPLLRPASLIISFMPLLLSIWSVLFATIQISVPISFWLLWSAGVAFVASWLLLHVRGPQFIREYRDYGDYAKRGHSHRWIVWEFHSNLGSLEGWKNVARETHSKGLSNKVSQQEPIETFRFCPLFDCPTGLDSEVVAHTPVNANRDIYLPLCLDGQRYVLPLQEDDPKRCEKERELFWILYAQAAKERPYARLSYWVLVTVAAVLLVINVIKNVLVVLL